MNKLDSKVYCQKCKNRNNHSILKSYTESLNVPWDIQYEHSFYIVQCMGCDTVAFVSEYGDESMIDYDEFGDKRHFKDVIVYPEEPKAEKISKFEPHKIQSFNNSPEVIKIMYFQIVQSFNMESYLLSAVGLRMLLEGVCNNNGITDGYSLDENGDKKLKKNSTDEVRSTSLEGKINGLVEKKLVVQTQANILHQIRELGNTTVHELHNPERKTIKQGIEILERILEQIYELHNMRLH